MEAIIERYNRLLEICEQYPVAIPPAVAAEYIGRDVRSLYAILETPNNGIGTVWRGKQKNGYVIPTLKFFNWVTGGHSKPPEL